MDFCSCLVFLEFRNHMVFKQKKMIVEQIMQQAHCLILLPVEDNQSVTRRNERWQKPLTGQIKANFDAAVRKGVATLAAATKFLPNTYIKRRV
ncbi:hypothetical protein glysoja_028052 [Glycine soja]|uniref:Uncharacterized protein n=1 Tax=Glycine soja TaxID=3848 RepID=A0A0B2PC76_GLYSO|nr:hypothetical protein glysoja_028052 [Glycine soja]